ncbi:CoA pyrophosphatase [Aquisediminimonas profunda]|uniref:CoA pyrophosphatase n=1 Tax=Aquisediminimonas profunda TaxID=1550733 RepID=UPI001C62FF57|nr:CoA pyrophosphatase [Aquisediminimonas profunda]
MTLVNRLRAALEATPSDAVDLLAGDAMHLPETSSAVDAAVLVAVTDRSEPGIILTKRPDTMRKHPGQVAFPGGRVDEADTDIVAAALREAHEEIALPPSAAQLVGLADRYRTITGFDVTPVIVVVPPDLDLHPNADEVEAIFEAPLSFVLDAANHMRRSQDWQGITRHYYEMHWDGFRIWGATAAMLVNLSRRLQWGQ